MEKNPNDTAGIDANMQLLLGLNASRQGHESMIATTLMVVVAANAGIFAVGESVAKLAGPVAIAFLGVATIVISFLTIWPRRQRLQVIRERMVKVEDGIRADLAKMELTLHSTLIEDDREDVTVSRLVHLAVLAFWIVYLVWAFIKPAGL